MLQQALDLGVGSENTMDWLKSPRKTKAYQPPSTQRNSSNPQVVIPNQEIRISSSGLDITMDIPQSVPSAYLKNDVCENEACDQANEIVELEDVSVGAHDFARFLVNNATKCAIELALSSCQDLNPVLFLLMANDLVEAIEDETEFEDCFVRTICERMHEPHAKEVFDLILGQMTPSGIKRLFSTTQIRRRNAEAILEWKPEDFEVVASCSGAEETFRLKQHVSMEVLSLRIDPGMTQEAVARRILESCSQFAWQAVSACAVDGSPYWQVLFDQGLVDNFDACLSQRQKMFQKFCSYPCMPYAADILDAYFDRMSPEVKAEFFSEESVKNRLHPGRQAFYLSTLTSPSSKNMLKVLDVMIKHGLPLQAAVEKNMQDFERSIFLLNNEFMKMVLPRITEISNDVLKSVGIKSPKPEEAISALIDQYQVPLDRFLNPKVMCKFRGSTKIYLLARKSRLERIPEAPFVDDDEEENE